MKRKTVYLNGTPLGVAQGWHQVSALLGHIAMFKTTETKTKRILRRP
jgi:hypothetical protein